MTSTIKVNTVKDTASTDIIKKCGTSITVGTASDTTTVAGNAVRSNAIQASDGQNIISQVGATITLGATGDNIVLAGGATQSGFGRTGTVDWQTTPKTATFTAVSGEGYFCNTSGGAFTVNLPAGVAGAIVSLADYAATWNSNNLTVSPNGTDKIGSVNADVVLNTEGQSVTFVFVDSTQGWINTMDSTSNVRGSAFICASVSGACNTLVTAPDCANVKIATFTGPGDFTVNAIGASAANNKIAYMVVAGGGGGGGSVPGYYAGGGGGAGGFRESNSPVTPYTASPLNGPGCTTLSVTAQTYPITVGAGGGGGPGGGGSQQPGVQGSNSIFSTVISAGGGYGGLSGPGCGGGSGNTGGSGGGSYASGVSAAGNTPPVSPPQGQPGGNGDGPGGGPGRAGGGGGAGGAGVGAPHPAYGAAGGPGVATSITASSVTRSAGGATGTEPGGPTPNQAPNTGNGGQSGNSSDVKGGNGGSGIVVIRYKFQ